MKRDICNIPTRRLFGVLTVALGCMVTILGTGVLRGQEATDLSVTDGISVPQVNEFPPPPPLPASSASSADAGGLLDDDGEVMLRGPVHEAFAEQFSADPVPGIIVQARPPEPVEELPPDVRPDGRTVEWISGYWAWNEDQNDFMWVSGIWREIPQGFRWLPGYWAEVDGGFQWVAGTWISAQTDELQYIETAPPASLEAGPAGLPPAPDQIWIPGCWSWQQTRYAWRPGYWSAGYSNWIWVPARYRWTPRGYYYSNGYWDYPLARRGVLFAPYYFRRPVYARRGFRFTPQIVVATNLLQFHLWVRPRYQHYYFGDYYNRSYASLGLQPWHQYSRQHRGSDPLFSHYSRSRGGSDFYNQINTRFNLFSNDAAQRPARTLRDQDRSSLVHSGGNSRQPSLLGKRFQKVVEDSTRNPGDLRFVKLENDQKQNLRSHSDQLRKLISQRQQTEVAVDAKGRARTNTERSATGRTGQGSSPGDRLISGQSRGGESAVADGAGTGTNRPDRLKLPPAERHTVPIQSGVQGRRHEGRGPGGTSDKTGPVPSADHPVSSLHSGTRSTGRDSTSTERAESGSTSARSRKEATVLSEGRASGDKGSRTDTPVPGNPVSRGDRPRGIDNIRRQTAEDGGRRVLPSAANPLSRSLPSGTPETGSPGTGRTPGQDSHSSTRTRKLPENLSGRLPGSSVPRSGTKGPASAIPKVTRPSADQAVRNESAGKKIRDAAAAAIRSRAQIQAPSSGASHRGGNIFPSARSRPAESRTSESRAGTRSAPGSRSSSARSAPAASRGKASPSPRSHSGSKGRSKR